MPIPHHTAVRAAGRPWLRAARDGDATLLAAGDRTLRYSGEAARLLWAVLPLLDGRQDHTEIAEKLGRPELAPAVAKVCRRLIADGMAVDATELSDRDDLLLAALPSLRPGVTESPTVRLVGDARQVEAVRAAMPLGWTVRPQTLATVASDADWGPHDFALLWVDDPNDAAVADWNEQAYDQRRPWLPITAFDGEVALVGPLVLPRQTPCYECLRRRRAAHTRGGESSLRMHPVGAVSATSAALTQLLAALAVAQLQAWTARSAPTAPGAVHTVTLAGGFSVTHEYVLRVPRCAACRPVAAATHAALWSDHLVAGDGV